MKKAYRTYGTQLKERVFMLWKFQNGKTKEKGTESIFKVILAEKLQNVGKKIDIQIHEAQRPPNNLILNRATLRYIIIKLSKDKDKKIIFKTAKERNYIR